MYGGGRGRTGYLVLNQRGNGLTLGGGGSLERQWIAIRLRKEDRSGYLVLTSIDKD
jgi:hypothetical protein